ncbi:MAG: hypothetical protein J2P27_03990 [Actinobacteria bacterium]|nr:hypothetical protein [Actinomycetota bacterium]
MRAPSAGRQGNEPDANAGGWRGCVPELMVTVVLILATSGAVYGYEGTGAAILTLIIWAVVLLVLLRGFATPAAAPPLRQEETWRAGARTSFTGFWRKGVSLADASASMVSYDRELRPTLQHLLAARLAERHDINLYQDPSAARRLLMQGTTRGRSDDRLWYWLDPSRPAETRQQVRGIPPKTLAALIDRLERL